MSVQNGFNDNRVLDTCDANMGASLEEVILRAKSPDQGDIPRDSIDGFFRPPKEKRDAGVIRNSVLRLPRTRMAASNGGAQGPAPNVEEVNALTEQQGPPTAPQAPQTVSSGGFTAILKRFAQHFPLLLGLYLAGYFRMSLVWIVGAAGLTAAREQWRKERDFRMNAARLANFIDEQDIIKARVVDLPSWVFFPDYERAEWLNRILKSIWPNVAKYIENIISESIEPSVREALTAYKLTGFKFDKMRLGSIPPRIGGVKVYDKNVSRNEIIMDMDICYAGDCDFRFSVKGMKAGIKDFQIKGLLRFILKPLVDASPFVGGVQVFFLNNPEVDFNLLGVADVLDMPGLADIMRRIISDQIGAIMVLPNKITVQLHESVQAETLKMHEPAGVLRVRLIEAKDLMKMDVGMLGKGKSDPYAIITVGSQEFRTKTIMNTVNPKWDFWCESIISCKPTLNARWLAVRLADWDQGKKDQHLGRASVDIHSLVKAGKKDLWAKLEDVQKGSIHLELTWFSLSPEPQRLKDHTSETISIGLSSAVVSVFIDGCKMLPVMDQKTNAEIGRAKIILVSLLTEREMTLSHQPLPLKNSGPDSKIIISAQLRILVQGVPEKESAPAPLPTPAAPLASKPTSTPVATPVAKVAPVSLPEPIKPTPAPVIAPKEAKEVAAVQPLPKVAPEPVAETVAPVPNEMKPSVDNDLKPEPELPKSTGAKDLETMLTSAMAPLVAPSAPPSISSSLSDRSTPSLRRRQVAGEAHCGRVQLTLRYSTNRQKFVVVVHQAEKLPIPDPTDLPDPYVKLYLLPDRKESGKRKTEAIVDTNNPHYDESFEFPVSLAELPTRNLEVSVLSKKQSFFSKTPLLGQTKVDLSIYNWQDSVTDWFDLRPGNE